MISFVLYDLGLPNLANKNTRCPVKFQFQINNEYIFTISKSQFSPYLC